MPWRKIRDVDQLGRLIDAILTVGTDLSLENVLHRIVEAAATLVNARYGALGVLDASNYGLAEFLTVGISPVDIAAIGPLPEGHGILGLLILEPEPLRLPDLKAHPDSYGFPPNHPPMASFLGVPIRIGERVFGNLYLTDKQSASEFSDEDEALAIALARAAAIAIDNARLHERVREFALGEDRERIAADLHDTVIQRLFATGLALEASLRLAPPELASRIEQSVTDLDETIRQIRTAIFSLSVPRAQGQSLRADVVAIIGEAARSLGYEPRLRFEGALDTMVSRSLGVQCVSVLRELLSNVARHAQATITDVVVEVTADELVLIVADDGRGIAADAAGGSGLRNVTQRAEQLGGTVAFGPRAEGGTAVLWRVPLG